MGFLDRLLGREPSRPQGQQYGQTPPPGQSSGQPYNVPAPSNGASVDDERAIARYKYLLRTAPPEAIEQVHAEAFAQLTPEQRMQVLERLSSDLPDTERPQSDNPQELARAATRAEMRQPGYLQQSFARPGMAGGFGTSMMGTIAGVVIGSMIANSLMGGYNDSPEAQESGDNAGSAGDPGGDSGGDAGGDAGGDSGGDSGAGGADTGGDFGGDASAWGGDFGGGDFGGGDFGGDFGF